MSRCPTINDDVILEAARRLFVEHGASLPVQVIADEVGLSEAAIYKRFATKSSLMRRALSPPRNPPFLAVLEAGPDGRSVDVQLVELLHLVYGYFRTMVPQVSVLKSAGIPMRDVVDAKDPPPLRALAALTGWFERASAAGLVGAVDASTCAYAVVAFSQHRSFWAHLNFLAEGPEADDRAVRAYVDTLLQGLRPEAA
jgi:AcrR family transcriptional regulator